MTTADVQAAQKRLMIPVSRKCRGTKKITHVAVRVGDDVLAALAKATTPWTISARAVVPPTAGDVHV
jgi:hypothetical protein